MARPESCLGAVGRKMGPPPPFNGDEPEGLARVPHGMALIDENDPDGSHWHLGPVAVEPGFQGRGVGHKVLAPAIARIVSDRDLGWLETDKPENVRFYLANGFAVVHHEVRFGVDYWFMSLES
jgi:GNAT superfamily N-acetyltransferase